MTPPSPSVVVFDLGKVLLDFDYARAARILAPHSRLGPEAFQSVLDQSPLLHRYESGDIDTGTFLAEVRTLTGFRADAETFRAAFGDIFSAIDPMIGLHAELRRRGIPTYIFSNTNEIAVGHVRERFPFFHGFDGYVFSHEVGAMKPRPEIYDAVERLTGRTGTGILYLDDRAENVAAGRTRGWHVIHHADPADSEGRVAAHFGWCGS